MKRDMNIAPVLADALPITLKTQIKGRKGKHMVLRTKKEGGKSRGLSWNGRTLSWGRH